MLIVIDESGDTGFKASSSKYFMLGALLFSSYKDAENLSKKVIKLRNNLGFNREFKFSSTSPKNKIKFFEEIEDCDFKFKAILVRKNKIFDKHLKTDSKEFYYYCLRLLLKNISREIHLVKIDNLGDRTFKFVCTQICNDFFPVAKVKFSRSSDDSLIQAADMLTGLCVKEYFAKETLEIDRRLIKKIKIEIV